MKIPTPGKDPCIIMDTRKLVVWNVHQAPNFPSNLGIHYRNRSKTKELCSYCQFVASTSATGGSRASSKGDFRSAFLI